VSGWGFLGEKDKRSPHNLQVAYVYLIPYEECRSINENNTKECIRLGMICAHTKESDACKVSTLSLFTYLVVIGNEISSTIPTKICYCQITLLWFQLRKFFLSIQIFFLQNLLNKLCGCREGREVPRVAVLNFFHDLCSLERIRRV